MFQGIISDAKAAAGSVVAKQAVRASVAVPFLIALGFATASIALMLVERFGARDAYLMLAGGFAVVGGLAALFVRTKEHEEIVADQAAAKVETIEAASSASNAAALDIPLAVLGAVLSSSMGPASIGAVARAAGRNLPLLLLATSIGALLWAKGSEQGASLPDTSGDNVLKPAAMTPNGAYHPGVNHPAH